MTYRNWTFTFIMPSEDEVKNIAAIKGDICKYIICGRELTKSGTPHLQGYIELNKCCRIGGIKKILDPAAGNKSVIHVEPAHTGREYNRAYCCKGLQSHEEWEQYNKDKLGKTGFKCDCENSGACNWCTHNFGPNYGKDAVIYEQTFKKAKQGQGKRNDWTAIYNKIKENPNFAEILEEFPEYAIKYPNGIQRAIDTVKNSNNLDSLKESLSSLKLFNWEVKLEKELKNQPDNRKVIWYVDKIGGGGKTTFAKYLLAQGNCTYFSNGKCADIARAYNGERIAIFDFTRSGEGRVNYSAVEQIKNGLIFSSKYESAHKINAIPHVICLSNFPPDESALSRDRWDIRHLEDIDKQVYVEDVSTPSKSDDSEDPVTPDTSSYEYDESYDNILISNEDEQSLSDCIEQSSFGVGNTNPTDSDDPMNSDHIAGALPSPSSKNDLILEYLDVLDDSSSLTEEMTIIDSSAGQVPSTHRRCDKCG